MMTKVDWKVKIFKTSLSKEKEKKKNDYKSIYSNLVGSRKGLGKVNLNYQSTQPNTQTFLTKTIKSITWEAVFADADVIQLIHSGFDTRNGLETNLV